jgi:transketolase C-terminal domain/subunit
VTQHPKLVQLGIQDLFGESGEPIELYEKFGISANAISQKVLLELKR